jgi:predicted nucleic acid-binding Zn ribbon protein
MARRKSRRRYDWKMILFLVISAVIALTMVLAFVLPALN